ncbi:MAG TPA: hypothetical protein VM939_12060, partial [Gemmatimonadaceae bacterium]|nr:hypothetical protein [Gemmatimonadaceae bacterium]
LLQAVRRRSRPRWIRCLHSGAKGLSDVKAVVNPDGAVSVSFVGAVAGGIYEVYRAISGGLFERIRTVSSFVPGVMSLIDNLGSNGVLLAKAAVVYKVRLTYPTGSKAPSEELISNEVIAGPKGAATATTRPPENAIATATSGTSVTLTWTPAVGVSQCQVRRSLNLAAYITVATLPVNTSRYIDVAANLMMQRPQYQIACGDAKGLAIPPVQFTTPVWNPKGG